MLSRIMSRVERRPVAVVGAGLAGVTAAHALRQRGIRFVCMRRVPGSLVWLRVSRTRMGFTSDFGAHFVTNRLAAAIGAGDQCRDVRHYGEAVLLAGRVYGYPFGLLGNPRFLLSGIAARIGHRPNGASRSAAEWFRAAYGPALANAVAIPLVEAWSGATAESLAPTVASEKLQHSVFHTLYFKLASKVTGRAVANGYSHEMPESPSVWHVYPEGGVSTLVQRLADGLERAPSSWSRRWRRLSSTRAGPRPCESEVARRRCPRSSVLRLVMCFPVLWWGPAQCNTSPDFDFVPMVFVNLRLRGRGLIPDTVLWTPESQFPFFRITETTRSMPWLAPAGKTVLTVDLGCEVNDQFGHLPDDRHPSCASITLHRSFGTCASGTWARRCCALRSLTRSFSTNTSRTVFASGKPPV